MPLYEQPVQSSAFAIFLNQVCPRLGKSPEEAHRLICFVPFSFDFGRSVFCPSIFVDEGTEIIQTDLDRILWYKAERMSFCRALETRRKRWTSMGKRISTWMMWR